MGDWPLRAARWLAVLALRAWPLAARRRDGPALLDAVEEQLRTEARRGPAALLRCAVAESAAVLAAGARLHVERVTGRDAAHGNGRGTMTRGWGEDLRVALRTLSRNRGFTAVAVATLGVGLGANAAAFGLVERVVFRPPPYAHPDALVLVWGTRNGDPARRPLPAPDAAAVVEATDAFVATGFMGRTTDASLALDADAPSHHAVMAGVTPGFFRVLGVGVSHGRSFLEEDAADGDAGAPVGVVLSDGAWRRIFRGSPDLPGRTVLLNGRPVLILGTLPGGFRMELPPSAGIGTDVDVWVPFRAPLSSLSRPAGRMIDQDSDNTGALVARLAPGWTVEAARRELDRTAGDLRATVPGYGAAGFGLDVRPLHADATAHARGLLLALLAGAGGLLSVATLSLAALLLARGMARTVELSVRVALGAGRRRVARALFAESLVLVVAGGALSVLLAQLATDAALRLLPPGLTGPESSQPAGGPALLFITGACTGLAVLFALLAAAQASLLGGPGKLVSSNLGRFRRGRARRVLVVAEVALSVVLVLGSGLLLRTAHNLRGVDPGFLPQGALALNASMRVAGAYTGPAARARLVHDLEGAAAAVPGVRAVGLTGALPLSGRRWTQPYGLPGEAPEVWKARRADFRMVTSGYFDAVGTRLLEGRVFTREEDLEERRRVVVIDETLARRLAPGGSALGATVGIPLDGEPVQARVVGVVEPVRFDALDRPGRETVYVPYRQEASRDVSFVIRTDGDPAALAPAVRRALLGVEPRLTLYGMRTLDSYVQARIAPIRFGVSLLAVYAVLALVAAALGLYGVMAWEVGRRRRDLGVRMALGATRAEARRWVFRSGVWLTTLGLAAGVGLAALASGGLEGLVYGVSVADGATWLGSLAVVAAVGLLASWLPAARVSRMEPTEALRPDS